MENSAQSNNGEPNAKRPKLETVRSVSSKPKSKDPFLSLPSDVLSKIILRIPVAQWPSLELLNPHFRDAISIAWRQLKTVNVEREFLINPEIAHDRSTYRNAVVAIESILPKLAERSPFLTSLRGIDIRSCNARMNKFDLVHSLATFEHLESMVVGDAKFFTDQRGGTPLEQVVEFMESTRSRASLKELRFYDVGQNRNTNRASTLDRFAASFVDGRNIHSPLKLEKFSFTSSDNSVRIRLDTFDTSRLTELRVGKTAILPDQLRNLIERASNLRTIELSFIYCDEYCNGPRLGSNKKLLMALASHENLTTIKFEKLGGSNFDNRCTKFGPEFIDMLKVIGRRGRIRKLAMEKDFVYSGFLHPILDMDQVCATICEYLPYLRAIRLNVNDITEESVYNIASRLVELEELRFTSEYDVTETASPIRKIAQLSRLKCLSIDAVTYEHAQSIKSLADATSLTDLRMRYSDAIRADIFEWWSDGFASELEILMLAGIGFENDDDEKGLVRLLEKAIKLRVLILDGRITEQSLVAIAKSCPELEIFGVRSMWNEITVDHLQGIVDRCPKLKRLGGFGEAIRCKLQFRKYRKIADVDMQFWKYDFDHDQYV